MSKRAGEDGTEQLEVIRAAAATAFNRAWELIELASRSSAQDEEMLEAAFASRYLWDCLAAVEQTAIGDWQIAHVASLLGQSSLALARAQRALSCVIQNGWTDWRLASCYEGMARAEAAAENAAMRDHWAALAREVLDGLDDDEDRALISAQLASIPGVVSSGGVASRPPHSIAGLDHVQVAMPAGAEAERAAEDFYGGILGLELRDKPPALAARGGRWFDNGRLKVHLGADPAFRPSDKAHVALVVEGLDHLVDLLAEAGHTIRWDTEVPGVRRCYTTDPFGNRIELIEASR